MTNIPQPFEKPMGLKDYAPQTMERLRTIERTMLACMHRWGYMEVRTPTLEYYDTVGTASVTSDERLFKLLDRWGKPLVLRPDMTAPIARLVCSALRDERMPLRLAYHANVFRTMEVGSGKSAEFWQAGAECIGLAHADADAETIALAIDCLRALGVDDVRFVLGHVAYVDRLLHCVLGEAGAVDACKHDLLNANDVGYMETVHRCATDVDTARALLRLRGPRVEDVLDEAKRVLADAQAHAALAHVDAVCRSLDAYGVRDCVHIDLTLLGHVQYYTGIVFEAYIDGCAVPICAGGRYDALLQSFGKSAPARGFAVQTERLVHLAHIPERQCVLVVYEEFRREEALRYAARLRSEGTAVITASREDAHVYDDAQFARTTVFGYT